MSLHPWITVGVGFLAGSIPFGVIFSRWMTGIDPRESGSRNIGFTNVLRVAGRGPGLLTLLGDLGKGYLAVRLAQSMAPAELWIWSTGLAAVLGHHYSVFLNFKGGKGVATGLGALYGINPWIAWILMTIWAVTVWIWRYSSLGAIVSFGLLPIVVLFLHPDLSSVGFSMLLSLFILIKHRANMHRLRSGTEPKIGRS